MHSGSTPENPDRAAWQIPDFDWHLFGEGHHWHMYRWLGSHLRRSEGSTGVAFAVWAPHADRVSVVGDFNRWDGNSHPMQVREGGLWEAFIPDLEPGCLYKYEIHNGQTGALLLKSDPYAQACERRPQTASRVCAPTRFIWTDDRWLAARRTRDWRHAPLSIYEVHLGSWRQKNDGGWLDYRELARQLAEYVRAQGFTHIELLPITEHPLDASWGYQTTGFFAPTSRYGTPDDFRWFIDHCHRHDIGVILDWTPAHFPRDDHGLARFDGLPLYEHPDPRRGEHPDWGTLIFDYGRNQVRSFLLSSAQYWLEEFHLDGFRVDAVASMLYLDYSRPPGQWLPNQYGGAENIEAMDFIRELNSVVHGQNPGAIVVAEESTAWPQVSRPVETGGLGFSMKWNMGWMHDTLGYLRRDPVYRCHHHDALTFGLLYTFNENFVLPLSHDEVVHGKQSLINKMPGDLWQQFANLRLLFSYQWTFPGKKLLFMGGDFAQRGEWNHERALEWHWLQDERHLGIQRLIGDLNRLHTGVPALYRDDFDARGFEWIDCHDSGSSTASFVRGSGDQIAVVVLNFTPVPRYHFRLGVPQPGIYLEKLNSDSECYGGTNLGNGGRVEAESVSSHGRPWSLLLTLPPLAALVLVPAG